MRTEISKKPEIKAVCAIFDNDESKILFQFDKKNSTFLRFPGGKIKHGETALDCVKREITGEEFGLEIREITPWIFCENFFNFSNEMEHEILIIHRAKLVNPKIKFPLKHFENPEILIDWFELSKLSEFQIVPKGISSCLQSDPDTIHYFSNYFE